MTDSICKTGKVKRITDNTIYITIVQSAGCSACEVKSACHSAEGKEKTIEVPNVYDFLQEGDTVQVRIRTSKGLKAVVYAFILPILLLFITLLISFHLLRNEAIAALVALTIVALYYTALYCLREKIRKEFEFKLEKI